MEDEGDIKVEADQFEALGNNLDTDGDIDWPDENKVFLLTENQSDKDHVVAAADADPLGPEASHYRQVGTEMKNGRCPRETFEVPLFLFSFIPLFLYSFIPGTGDLDPTPKILAPVTGIWIRPRLKKQENNILKTF